MTDMESTQLSQPVPTPATHTHRLIPVYGWPDTLQRFDLELEGFGIIARIKQSLLLLKEDLRQWAPKQTPVLVPIPIPAERRTRHSDRRHSARGD